MKTTTIFCADCEYHVCKCECFSDKPCSGFCDIKGIFIKCYRSGKKCEYYVLDKRLKLS